MRNRNQWLSLFLILGAWPGTSEAQAAIADAVVAWGNNAYGQTTVPVEAQSGVIAIATGSYHTVALKKDGSVLAWGANADGQTKVPVEAQSGVMAVAGGGNHTLALKTDGSVLAWGGYPSDQSDVPVAAKSGVKAIAATYYGMAALKTDGSVVVWGEDLGLATVPVKAQSGVTAIAAGSYHIVTLKNDGTVVAWGAGMINDPSSLEDYGQSIVPAGLTGVTAIAAGDVHTVALKRDGSVIVWGNDAYGQTTVPVAAQNGVTAISAGGVYTVALKFDGTLVAWGENHYGQVTSTPTTIPTAGRPYAYEATASPVTLSGQVLSGVIAIAAGETHTVALAIPMAPAITSQPTNQAVALWQRGTFTVASSGFPLNYQWLKDGMNIPGATSDTYRPLVTQTIAPGSYTVVVSNIVGTVTSAPPAVLTANQALPGSVVAWGAGTNDMNFSPDYGQSLVPIAAQSGVTAIAGGLQHSVALKADGSVVAWGAGTSNTGYYPDFGQALVPTAARSGVTAITAIEDHTVALKSDGSVLEFGNFGLTPVPFAAQSGVTAIAAGSQHSVALKADGSVVAWGNNYFGQVTGVSVTDPPSAIANPVALEGRALTAIRAIAAGWLHTVALKNDGTLVAWGNNEYGQVIGTPTTNQSAQANPVTLDGRVVSGVTAIAAGGFHTLALRTDGSVLAWGNNEAGQTSVPLAAQSGVKSIAGGGYHTVALKTDGSVVAWGRNDEGQTIVPAGLTGVTAIAAGRFHTLALFGFALSLEARFRGNELVVFWPASATGFTLQTTSSLSPPVNWVDLSQTTAMVQGQFILTNTASSRPQFYRLRKL
jgi:alpha-tubulin suppressor-like RCC1 family protein